MLQDSEESNNHLMVDNIAQLATMTQDDAAKLATMTQMDSGRTGHDTGTVQKRAEFLDKLSVVAGSKSYNEPVRRPIEQSSGDNSVTHSGKRGNRSTYIFSRC